MNDMGVDDLEAGLELLRMAGHAALGLLAQPFYYIAVLFIILQYTRQTRLERQLFHVRLHIWPRLLVRTLIAGLAVGVFLSVAGIFLGSALSGSAVIWLWSTAAVLMLLRIRYLCFAYSAGLLGLMQWGFGFTSLAERGDWLGRLFASLDGLDVAGLLMLVAVLHLAEALLVARQGDKLATPLFLEGKRGKLVGGYMLQGFWPVPLLMLVPMEGGSTAALPWTPLFGPDWSQGWSIIALPMIIGFSELTRSMLPKDKARHAAKGLVVYSVILAGAALLAWWQPVLLPAAAVVALMLHEGMVWLSMRKEAQSTPFYVNDERGLRILGIVPGTPAEAMGLVPGEIMHKVNGQKVRSKESLHDALQVNSAFSKLEVYNLEGQLKFVSRARYAGEHHQLGVILSPDEQANYYAVSGHASLFSLLRASRTSNRRGGGPGAPTVGG
ncbi:PDZ domain-containing protein [Paenibacillus sp. GCM10023252]|uniref:PDZ domain-containing protein n=1 Tax=Paenibacillus sp. GCM10023252 TaxID=3252649 RepID=UPI003606E943